MSKDIVILVLPFAQMMHENESLKDYWRFTPSALSKMYENNGLEVIYRNVNNDINAGIYLFFVGAKNPDKWENNLFHNNKLEDVGFWIGENYRNKLFRFFSLKKNK